jgi:biotin operon repressor
MLARRSPSNSNVERPKLTIDCDSVRPNARAIGYVVTVNFVDEYSSINSAFGDMRPAKLMIYLAIVLSTVQKQMRDPTPEQLGTQSFEDADCGMISRRAIAESTGIPRENVRRIVKELIDEGRIMEASRGYLRQPSGFMLSPGIVESTNNLLSGLVKTMQILIDMNVVKVK